MFFSVQLNPYLANIFLKKSAILKVEVIVFNSQDKYLKKMFSSILHGIMKKDFLFFRIKKRKKTKRISTIKKYRLSCLRFQDSHATNFFQNFFSKQKFTNFLVWKEIQSKIRIIIGFFLIIRRKKKDFPSISF